MKILVIDYTTKIRPRVRGMTDIDGHGRTVSASFGIFRKKCHTATLATLFLKHYIKRKKIYRYTDTQCTSIKL